MGPTDSPPPTPVSSEALLSPASPAAQFVESASKAPPDSAFTPTDACIKLAETLFTSNAPSFVALVEESGVSRSQIWRLLNDPEAAQWIVEHGTKAAQLALGAVHARLLHLALTSRSPAALELYLKRFDPEYRTVTSPTDQSINAEFAFITQMSPSELDSFVRLKTRKQGLDASARPVLSVPAGPH